MSGREDTRHQRYSNEEGRLSCSLASRSTSRCRSSCGRSSGSKTSFTAMLTSTTLNPVRFSTRFITLRRTASEICGIDLPYSTAIERSTAASSSPTCTDTPRVGPPPVTLFKNPPTAREVPPPICIPSISWAAIPAILETTMSLMLVPPRPLLRDEALVSSPRGILGSSMCLFSPFPAGTMLIEYLTARQVVKTKGTRQVPEKPVHRKPRVSEKEPSRQLVNRGYSSFRPPPCL